MRLTLMILTLTLLTLTAHAASPAVICRSPEKVDGWDGGSTNEPVLFTAYVESDTQLRAAEVKGAYVSDTRDLAADTTYRPRARAYQGLNRFGPLEDAWHWFSPLLPKDLLAQRGTFRAYLQVMGEEGYKGTLALNCFLKK